MIPPQDDIFQLFEESIKELKENDIIFITSKIIAIHQGRCYPGEKYNKPDLIKQEAEKRIISDAIPGHDTYITVTAGTLIPTAGIDESNANGHFILRPNNLEEIAKDIRTYFHKRFQVNNIGIIFTDSTTRPLRKGVIGISMYAYGIQPLNDMRGRTDIFGKELKITQVNVLDNLSGMAVYLMGESDECCPIIIGRDIPNLQFSLEAKYEELQIAPNQDLFKPLLKPLR